MDYMADDAKFVAERLRQIAEEREAALRSLDPERATGEHLDRIAQDYGLKRDSGEGDWNLRGRIKIQQSRA